MMVLFELCRNTGMNCQTCVVASWHYMSHTASFIPTAPKVHLRRFSIFHVSGFVVCHVGIPRSAEPPASSDLAKDIRRP